MKRKITAMMHYPFIVALTLYCYKSYEQCRIQKQRITSNLTKIVKFCEKNYNQIAPSTQAKLCKQCKDRASFVCRKSNIHLHSKCFKAYHMDT